MDTIQHNHDILRRKSSYCGCFSIRCVCRNWQGEHATSRHVFSRQSSVFCSVCVGNGKAVTGLRQWQLDVFAYGSLTLGLSAGTAFTKPVASY